MFIILLQLFNNGCYLYFVTKRDYAGLVPDNHKCTNAYLLKSNDTRTFLATNNSNHSIYYLLDGQNRHGTLSVSIVTTHKGVIHSQLFNLGIYTII